MVVKGPPWIPAVEGSGTCAHLDDCQTFTAADALHLRAMNYSLIRLGVVWAGGQPTAEPKLDADFEARLRAILQLCDAHGINVVLDVHQDAVGTAVCGEGVPPWFSALATPGQLGKPLHPVQAQPDGSCGANDTATWAEFAGDIDYNIKNRCCRKLNQGSWGQLTGSKQSQQTVKYWLSPPGRKHYSTYMGLLAAAVKDSPAAIAIELMNEPPTIDRAGLFTLWEECYDAIRQQSPTIAVGIMDPSQASLGLGDLGLTLKAIEWLKRAKHLFYAFHWYGAPSPPSKAVANAVEFGKRHVSLPSSFLPAGLSAIWQPCQTRSDLALEGVADRLMR